MPTKCRYATFAPGEICFKALIRLTDVGNSLLAGDAIEIRGNFSPDAVSCSWRRAFWIWALEYYRKRIVMHLLVVGNTLLLVDSHRLQGVCSQHKDPFSSQNLASGIMYVIITAKICFELCSGKALCTSVGDSHQCVCCCFLAIPDAGGRKISINSSFEATQIIRTTGNAFPPSCSCLLRLQTFGSQSVSCPALFRSFGEAIPVL